MVYTLCYQLKIGIEDHIHWRRLRSVIVSKSNSNSSKLLAFVLVLFRIVFTLGWVSVILFFATSIFFSSFCFVHLKPKKTEKKWSCFSFVQILFCNKTKLSLITSRQKKGLQIKEPNLAVMIFCHYKLSDKNQPTLKIAKTKCTRSMCLLLSRHTIFANVKFEFELCRVRGWIELFQP